MTPAHIDNGRSWGERDLLTLHELIDLTGWGKTTTYERARTDSLPIPTLRNGRQYYFSRRAYEAYRDRRDRCGLDLDIT